MSELCWRLFAWICAKPAVCGWLIRRAQRRPYIHIGEYMCRFWLVPPTWRLPFTVRIHQILKPDADPYLHDHPWNWRTIILRGWYIEEDVFGNCSIRRTGSTAAFTAETFHRIEQLPSEGVWTLFVMGRRRNRWGFMTGKIPRKVWYRDYVSVNGRGDLTEPKL